jgi:hypothetical protein
MARIKRAAVKAETFVKVWTQGCKDGLTVKQIAAKLNMNPDSASVRASQLRKKFTDAGIKTTLPSPSGETGGGAKKLDVAALAATVAALQAADSDETETDGE